MYKKKVLMLICDGLGDRSVKELGNKTPLQAAEKKNMDFFAQHGLCGLMDPIAPGIRPGSDTAQLSLLGYNPHDFYTGRGPFEAAGVGIEMRPGDIAFRCNFAAVDEHMNVLDRRAGRISKGTRELAETLDGMRIEDIEVIFREAVEHRAVLVLRGPGLSHGISDPDPHENSKVLESVAESKDAEKTARVLNAFVGKSYDILRSHPVNKERIKEGLPPANIILPRGGGMAPHIKSFREKYGMKAACIAGVSLIKGICRIVGMKVIDVKGATGTLDTDMMAKAHAAVAALNDFDFVYVNVKAADICGHDGLAMKKIEVAGRMDEMVGYFKERMSRDVCFVLTADHSTPISVRDHSADPVPIVIFTEDIRRDDAEHFDEISCSKGALGRIRGQELMLILMSLTGRGEKYGS